MEKLDIMKKIFLLLSMAMGLQAHAQHVYELKDVIIDGPFQQVKPITVDTVDLSGKKLNFTDGLRQTVRMPMATGVLSSTACAWRVAYCSTTRR